jgi:hypothetical protein
MLLHRESGHTAVSNTMRHSTHPSKNHRPCLFLIGSFIKSGSSIGNHVIACQGKKTIHRRAALICPISSLSFYLDMRGLHSLYLKCIDGFTYHTSIVLPRAMKQENVLSGFLPQFIPRKDGYGNNRGDYHGRERFFNLTFFLFHEGGNYV